MVKITRCRGVFTCNYRCIIKTSSLTTISHAMHEIKSRSKRLICCGSLFLVFSSQFYFTSSKSTYSPTLSGITCSGVDSDCSACCCCCDFCEKALKSIPKRLAIRRAKNSRIYFPRCRKTNPTNRKMRSMVINASKTLLSYIIARQESVFVACKHAVRGFAVA